MILWQLLCIIGIFFVILEIFTPSMFFLNFALSSFITAICSVFTHNTMTLVIIFFIFSFVSFAFLRPLILKKFSKETETGVESKYIGQVAKVIEEISEYKGVISIYGERFEARSIDKSIISVGEEVKIIKNDSIVMFVERINSDNMNK